MTPVLVACISLDKSKVCEGLVITVTAMNRRVSCVFHIFSGEDTEISILAPTWDEPRDRYQQLTHH